MKSVHPDAVLALGDNQYPAGTPEGLPGVLRQDVGRLPGITYPVPGNHEYGTPAPRATSPTSAAARRRARQGLLQLRPRRLARRRAELRVRARRRLRRPTRRRRRGCGRTSPPTRAPAPSRTGTGRGSPRAPTATTSTTTRCGGSLAAARRGCGSRRPRPRLRAVRPRSTPTAGRDAHRVSTEFVVGTGGDSHYKFHLPDDGSALRLAGSYGVLRLELATDGFSWQFLRAPGGTITDSGSTRCH